jgi:hypothetical protein
MEWLVGPGLGLLARYSYWKILPSVFVVDGCDPSLRVGRYPQVWLHMLPKGLGFGLPVLGLTLDNLASNASLDEGFCNGSSGGDFRCIVTGVVPEE